MQQRQKASTEFQLKSAQEMPVRSQTDAERKAQLWQKFKEDQLAYELRMDEEIGYIDGCFDESDELALLREFGL
jgi:hypothetical protein